MVIRMGENNSTFILLQINRFFTTEGHVCLSVYFSLSVNMTYPRHHKLSAQILHLCFDFTADIELVTVKGYTL